MPFLPIPARSWRPLTGRAALSLLLAGAVALGSITLPAASAGGTPPARAAKKPAATGKTGRGTAPAKAGAAKKPATAPKSGAKSGAKSGTKPGAGAGAKSGTSVKASTKKTSAGSAKKTTPRKKSGKKRRGRRAPEPLFTADGKPIFRVKAAVVVDVQTDQVLYEKNSADTLPIASITKLVSALVVRDMNPNWGEEVTVTRADLAGAGVTQLRRNEKVSLGNLLRLSLISSDNAATRLLARSTGLTDAAFAGLMNEKSRALGLTGSTFVEPTGLSAGNVMTAIDCVKLIRAAQKDSLLAAVTSTPEYEFRSNRRTHRLLNTNRLVRANMNVLCSKTGFISASGYCLAMSVNHKGREVAAIILGARSNAARFAEARRLLDWVLS